jgi:DNA invertase Pin-like site-specific DNA recombinase
MDPAEPIRAALRRYARARDPLERLRALADAQREAPAALVAAVAECREHGNTLREVGTVLNLGRTTLYEQIRAGAIQAGPEHEELSA